jgi:hypothetical protein
MSCIDGFLNATEHANVPGHVAKACGQARVDGLLLEWQQSPGRLHRITEQRQGLAATVLNQVCSVMSIFDA